MALRHKVDRSALTELARRASARESIVHFIDRRDGLGVLEDEPDLIVRFRDATQKGGIHEIDLSHLRSRPVLARAAADAVAAWGVGVRVATRQALCDDLAVLWRFLDDYGKTGPDAAVESVGDITTKVANAYVAWLNDQRCLSGKAWSDQTKGQTFGSLRIILDTWRRLPRYRAQLSSDLFIRFQLWRGRKRKVKPRGTLSDDVLRRIVQACLQEISETMKDLETGEAILGDETIVSPAKPQHQSAFKEFKVALASLGRRYAGPLPTIKQMKKDHELLGKAVHQYHSRRRFEEHLYLTPHRLVPLIVLFCMTSFFNPEPLLTLSWTQVEREHPLFGDERWRVVTEKARAGGRKQYRSFPARVTLWTNPVQILRTVERYTTRLRPLAELRFADRVFLCTTAEGVVRGYEGVEGASSDALWKKNLQSFQKRHGLPRFSLSNLRSTGSDIVHELTDGDLRAQQVALGHTMSSPDLTENHYTSDGAKRRSEEALAGTEALRERWIHTEGRADTRNVPSVVSTKRAVTPGFECLDPFHSPQPGQQQGRMCTAYGVCPSCPLALVNVKDPLALVRLIQLLDGLRNVQVRVAPQRWLLEFAPQLRALEEKWLPRFSDPTVKAAAEKRIVPPLPSLE